MSSSTEIGLTAAQFEAEFPFYLQVGCDGAVRRMGASLARIMPPGPAAFGERFRVIRPEMTADFAGLAAWGGKLLVLESRFEPVVRLRGSVQLQPDGRSALLLLSPWITRVEDIEALGLSIGDFGAHDPAVDLLFLQQSNLNALEDTRRLAARLRERTASLDSISALSPDGIVLFGEEGRVSYANPALGRMLGEPVSFFHDMTEETFTSFLVTLLDFGQTLPDFQAMAAAEDAREGGGERRRHARATFTIAQPQRRVVSCSVRAREGESKVLYFRDITRETEVDRMKSEFLSTAAHELRTPMASVYGFSELLLKRDYDDSTRRDLLGTIHRQAGALIHLLNELLDLARIEARSGKDFRIARRPLRPIVEQTVAALLMPNDARKVEVALPAALPECDVDEEKFQQALTNLLSNAYKYSPGGGTIRLDAVFDDDGGRVGIRVRDEGLGMTREQLARCFERFYRADTSGNIPGTGLGLALVKEIMDILGGSVEIDSVYGAGTTCVLWLPRGGDDAARAA